MSDTLRMILLFAAVLTALWILSKIRKLKVKMEDAIFWVVFALILLILGIFPDVTYWLTRKMGVMSPANLISWTSHSVQQPVSSRLSYQ